MAAAESDADKAAANTATLTAERERAAQRLQLINQALTDAQDQLNLALLDQNGAADAVTAAQNTVNAAQARFNAAEAALQIT